MNDDKISREALKETINSNIAQATKVGIIADADYLWSLLNYAIDNAPPAPDWTPVTEGLPKEAFGCMVTVWDTDRRTQEDFETVLPYPVGYDGETWNDAEGDVIPFEVIAWQPWPSPYKAPEIDLGRGV